MNNAKISNCIDISDTHIGCQFALCPSRVRLDGGGTYRASKFQRSILRCWNSFWDKWVPMVTRGEPYCVVLNGDGMDGRHHRTSTQISQNLTDQQNMAYEILAPVVEKAKGGFYFLRGSRAHSGEAGENEEDLAERLGAVKDEAGNHSRYELWLKIGECLAHFSHHIGVTSSAAYETSALMGEYANACVDSAKWKLSAPDVIARAHRHIHTEIRVPTKHAYGIVFVTSGWQLKTPFVYRTPGGRVRTPTIGGSLIRQGDEEFYTRHKTWSIPRVKTEIPKVEAL